MVRADRSAIMRFAAERHRPLLRLRGRGALVSCFDVQYCVGVTRVPALGGNAWGVRSEVGEDRPVSATL